MHVARYFFDFGHAWFLIPVLLVLTMLAYGSAVVSSGMYMKVICRARATPSVALTFDDRPGPGTAAILDILKEHQVKATFFVIGSKAEKEPALIQRIQNEGHLLGNH